MLLNLEAVGTSWDLKWVNCRTRGRGGGLQGRNGQVSEVDTESNALFSFAQKWSKSRWEGSLELLLPPLSYNYSNSKRRWEIVGVRAYKCAHEAVDWNYFPYTSVFSKKGGITHAASTRNIVELLEVWTTQVFVLLIRPAVHLKENLE